MKKSAARCPDCGGEAVEIGPIPATDVFAGRTLDNPLAGGSLCRCRKCSLGFRWPRLRKDELDLFYAQGDEQAWTAPANSRQDWSIARDWVVESLPAGKSVLDVGCFDGGFLESFVDAYHCFGIEIHAAARGRAEQKGIEVIGSDFSSVAGDFDFITAFDVIEHVECPSSFLQDCLATVRPGGYVLVSTGNLDALTFRLMGSRYWYCAIAEHISFVSPTWFSGLANILGYKIVRQTCFAHGNTSIIWRIRHITNNLLYRVAPSGFRWLRKLGMGGRNANVHPELADYPPGWGSARDHFMILLRKQ